MKNPENIKKSIKFKYDNAFRQPTLSKSNQTCLRN